MSRSSASRVRTAVAACGVSLLWSFAAHAAPADTRYQITDLGDLTSSGTQSVTFVAGISDNGEIVGQSFNDQLSGRAYLWERGRMSDLGDLVGPPETLSAFAIGKHSEVVGTSIDSAGVSHAFQWNRFGGMQALPSVRDTGLDTFATSVNGRGDVVGSGYVAAGDLRAVVWSGGKAIELGSLSDGRIAVQAFGINDKGDMVGYLSPGGDVSFAHAFVWKAKGGLLGGLGGLIGSLLGLPPEGELADIGVLPGTEVSFANALNERGQVVGQSVSALVPDTARAFLWEEGTLTDLGTAAPTDTRSDARAINKQGTVVGLSGTADATVAWVWSEGVITDLNTLIAADDPSQPYVHLTTANGVNDKGEIVAQGFDSRLTTGAVRSYVLTPVKGKKN